MPKISIITATYNKPRYLKDTITSVLKQTYGDFEHLIVDNSEDGSNKEIVQSFKDRRLKYFFEKTNDEKRQKVYMPAYVCNKYYQKASGDYIVYISDDDIFLPDCFNLMKKFLDKNPKASICYHNQAIVYALSGFVFWEKLVRGSNKVFRYPFANPKDALDGGQIMFRKKALVKIGKPYLPQKWDTADICDKIFMEKLWRKYQFYPINKVLSIHRVVDETTHKGRNPLKYWGYIMGTQILPVWFQEYWGTKTGKRTRLTNIERNSLKQQIFKVLPRGIN